MCKGTLRACEGPILSALLPFVLKELALEDRGDQRHLVTASVPVAREVRDLNIRCFVLLGVQLRENKEMP